MLRFLLFCITFLAGLAAEAQERTMIIVERSDFSRAIRKNGQEIVYIRNPTFRQGNAVMTCDSAVFFATQNYFEAYRNVHINQADTIHIYSQRLTYNGNTKQAHLTDKVRLLDRSSILTTNVLDYDMSAKIGTYRSGGKIENKDVNITSKNGYYFASSRDAYFRYNVVVITEQNTIKSDTMRYNTLSNWTYFYGPTHIKGKDDNLFTELGTYNTRTEIAVFSKNNLYTQGSKSLKGDSLYYDGKKGYGRAVKNILYIDTVDKTTLHGQLGEYFKSDERALVTQNAYVGLESSDTITVDNVKKLDSLFIGADTLESKRVLRNTIHLVEAPSLENLLRAPVQKKTSQAAVVATRTEKNTKSATGSKPVGKSASVPDSVSTPVANLDTVRTRIIKAYHNVRVFKGNLQAVSDSLFYADADSTVRWFGNPIMWAEGSQQTGDTIMLKLKNKKLSSFQVIRNAFLVNVEGDSTKFNQVKGRTINGFFADGALHTLLVDGNAESIYYDRNEKEKVTDRNQTVSGKIKVLVKNKKITRVKAQQNVEMVRQPIAEVTDDKRLTGFEWKPELRPVSKAAVIGKPFAQKKPLKKKAAAKKQ